MELNLLDRLVLLLVLLTRNALADCFDTGITWSDIGDDKDVTKAFNTLCSRIAGNYSIGTRASSQGRH